MNKHRVVITGLGCISALGLDLNAFWHRLIAGESGISDIKNVSCEDLRFKNGAEVADYDENKYFERSELSWMDRFAQFALIAASEAIADAKLSAMDINGTDTAVITGACLGGRQTEDTGYYRVYRENKKTVAPNIIPNTMINAGASHISTKFGITGPVFTFSTACSSSSHAIGHAFWMIRNGMVNRAITGGSEAPFCFAMLKAWDALRVVTSGICRPFSKNRNGMVLGEGGAMLVLESLSSALERNAKIYAEITGFGMSSDAGHITNPSSAGQLLAMQSALNDAAIAPSSIQYINAHGTGTIMNDQIETQSIRAFFPSAHDHLLVSSTKAAHGHLLGATGAIEAIATILAIKNAMVPPTINFMEKDNECDLPMVVNQAVSHDINYALSSSFAFGGLNAILLFKKYDGRYAN